MARLTHPTKYKILGNQLKRNDGTTAASRLFGQQFPDLLEYLVENIGELPQPRKPKKSSNPKTLTLPTVPS